MAGCKPLVISTVHMECSEDSRLVLAGGTLMNVIAGAVFFALGHVTSSASSRLKYFLWISMTVISSSPPAISHSPALAVSGIGPCSFEASARNGSGG